MSALAVRLGEHACCRFTRRADRRRVVSAFVADSVRRGHRVVHLCEDDPPEALAGSLAGDDPAVAAALSTGQAEVRSASAVYLPGGVFEMERVLDLVHSMHEGALRDGWAGLSVSGDMAWAQDRVDPDVLGEYERRVSDVVRGPTIRSMCQYDQRHFGAARVDELARLHAVDAAPELAPAGRGGRLAAARLHDERAIRLAGQLDFHSGPDLARVLHAHVHGDLRVDLADLEVVDVAGMRALRRRTGRRLVVLRASEPVRRLAALLAWDTDSDVELEP